MSGIKGEVLWPRLVASKIFGKRFGGNNFVADYPAPPPPTLSLVNGDQLDDHDFMHQIPPPAVAAAAPSLVSSNHDNPTNFKVFVSTWNVGGVSPADDFTMDELIDHTNPCDIYVFGFQEVVPLRAENVLGAEKSKISTKWNSLIRAALVKQQPKLLKTSSTNFRCIISKQMVGIFISVWVRADLRPFIRSPTVSCVGCGIMGCLGNKGSVSVRFRLHETSFCFVCTHLASGGRQADHKYRNSNVLDIFSRTTFPRGPSLDLLPSNILDHDRVIFFGDLNYRISLPESTTRQLVHQGDWDALLQHDQLKMEQMEGKVFEGWHEGSIKFGPTYKFYPGTDEYYGIFEAKKGEKKRAPAWCDRIIWEGEGLKQHVYERVESKLSDHKPVRAIFSTQVKVKLKLRALGNFFLSERFERIDDHRLLHFSSKDDCHHYDFPCSIQFTADL